MCLEKENWKKKGLLPSTTGNLCTKVFLSAQDLRVRPMNFGEYLKPQSGRTLPNDLSLLNNFPSDGVGKSISRLFQVSVVGNAVPSPLVPHGKEFLHIANRFGT
jgi:hypothetical protein